MNEIAIESLSSDLEDLGILQTRAGFRSALAESPKVFEAAVALRDAVQEYQAQPSPAEQVASLLLEELVSLLLRELGGIADALAAGETVIIEPGSVKAESVRRAVTKADAIAALPPE